MDMNAQRQPVAPANNSTGSKISATTNCTHFFLCLYCISLPQMANSQLFCCVTKLIFQHDSGTRSVS